MEIDYPSNSRNVKEAAPEPKKVEKIVDGGVVRRKKPLGRRMMETFVGGDDASSVFEYVVRDVMVPAAKDMFSDAISQGVERMLFGEVRNRNSPRSRASSSYTSYNRYSQNQAGPLTRREDPRRDNRPELSRRARATHDFDEIILPTKVDAEEVLSTMFEMLSQYNAVAVSDLYEMVGISTNFTDHKYGWTDLRTSGVTRVKSGYLLDLPRPESLD